MKKDIDIIEYNTFLQSSEVQRCVQVNRQPENSLESHTDNFV